MTTELPQDPPDVVSLVNSYKELYARVGPAGLNEAETRIRFLDNLFRAIGWDVGSAGTSRVRVEPRHIDGTPDYEFFTSTGRCAFLCEAKRASDPADSNFAFSRDEIFQAKRYAYSLGVPIVVLSNLALTRVFAVTAPPDLLSPEEFEIASLRMNLEELASKFNVLRMYLSPTSVDGDGLDAVLNLPRRGPKSPVTTELLAQLLRWRVQLANGFFQCNPSASDQEIDAAASLLVDRLIFAKFLIDRHIEDDFLLFTHGKPDVEGLIQDRFQRLQQIYNGGLFAPHEIDQFKWPGASLDLVLGELGSQRFKFDFSALPVEILGDIYESFIGVRAVRNPSSSAMILELTENTKKQHGIYYTPRHTVGFMADLALRTRLADISYKDILKIKVLDPACGSGSFLVACYRRLLDAALAWWTKQPDGPKRKAALHEFRGRLVLAAGIKKEILESCIFGIDHDSRALDIAALSLYLLLVEDDDRNGLLYYGTPLPSLLNNNLLPQNSLIDDSSVDSSAFAPAGRFKDAMDAGGFDLCIMNPPYVFGEWIPETWKVYFSAVYSCLGEQPDYYAAFIERCVRRYLRPRGVYSVIVPDAILAREQRRSLRELLVNTAPPQYIYHAGPVFEKVDVDDLERPKLSRQLTGVSAAVLIGQLTSLTTAIQIVEPIHRDVRQTNEVQLSDIRLDPWLRFLIALKPEEWPTVRLLQTTGRTIGDLLRDSIARGEEIGKRSLAESPSEAAANEVISGDAIERFLLNEDRYYAPKIEKAPALYQGPRVLVRKTDNRCIATRDESSTPTLQSVYILRPIDEHAARLAVSILNSKIVNWYVSKTITAYKKLYPQLTQEELSSLPAPNTQDDPGVLVEDAERLARDVYLGLRPDSEREYKDALVRLETWVQSRFGVHMALDELDLTLFDVPS